MYICKRGMRIKNILEGLHKSAFSLSFSHVAEVHQKLRGSRNSHLPNCLYETFEGETKSTAETSEVY